jgi:diamine N-acetyltransferase
LEFIYAIENRQTIWEVSQTTVGFVKQYLENAHQDIYEAAIAIGHLPRQDFPALGLIDLFDFDPKIIGQELVS